MPLNCGNLRSVWTAILSCSLLCTVTGFDCRAEAVITHVSDPAPLGKISTVVGDGWAVGEPQVRPVILDNGSAGNPGSFTAVLPAGTKTEPVAVVREESQVLTCELPGTGYRVAALQVREDKAWSRPFFVNRVRIDWLSTDQAAPGDSLRALGRNLVDLNLYAKATLGEMPGSHGGYVKSDTRVVMRNGDGEDVSCTVVKAIAYDVHFRVPDNLPDGEHTVYLHNGLGGPAGWSLPQTVKVAPRKEWPTKVFNVADFGVTVYLHQGVYPVRSTMEFDERDAGRVDAPIVYRAWGQDEVRIMGGMQVDSALFRPVMNPDIRKRLWRGARDRVMQLDLSALGVKDYGEIGPGCLDFRAFRIGLCRRHGSGHRVRPKGKNDPDCAANVLWFQNRDALGRLVRTESARRNRSAG